MIRRDTIVPGLWKALPAILLLAAITCSPGAGRLNVLLVSFDTTRADRLGCYGYHQPVSPVLDSLAAGGVLFSRCYTPTPITLPAHASLLTGAWPLAHGVRTNGSFRLGAEFQTLAERLGSEGYRCAGVVGAFVLDSRYGLAQGFDLYDDRMSEGGRRTGVLGQRERRAEEVTDRALGWLRGNTRGPFFLFVHYFDPHRPFEAPEPYAGRFSDPYDAEIAYTDSQLGRLLAALDSLHLADNTVVVVCADHGEGLDEHGEATHATFIYNSTVHVPLVFRVPDRPELRGAVPDREASLVDVAPTIAALCGVEPPENSQGQALIGRTGLAAPPPGERPVYLECYYPYYSHGWSPLEGVVSRGFKYIRAPEPELYALLNDPREQRNLLAADSARARRYSRMLALFRQKYDAGGDAPTRPAAARSPGSEEARRLRSLGYVSGRYREAPDDFSGLPDPKRMIATFSQYMLGVTYMSDGRLDLAAREFERILEEDPNNYSVWEFLAETELQRGNPGLAEKAARRAMEAPEPGERAFFCLGMARLEEGDTAAAAELMERTLDVGPGYAPALVIKARLLDARGSSREALGFYRAALETIPDNPDLLTDMGSCLISLGRIDEARRVLARAAGMEDASWRAGYNLGVALQVSGELGRAAEAYRAAASLPQAGAGVFNNLGICLAGLEKYDDALEAYSEALRRDSTSAGTWNNMAGCLAALGRSGEAARAYSSALRLDPAYNDALVNYALLLARELELPDSAAVLLDRALSLDPRSPRASRARELLSGLRSSGRAH